jgi:sugar phosphate isomerase/epimerase
MQVLDDLEIGVMFWGGGDPGATLRRVKATGVRAGQLGIPPAMEIGGATDAWRKALSAEQFQLVTVFAAFDEESYADIPTVRRTVGFVPPATRRERERRTVDIIRFAAALEAPGIACHIGCIPEDTAHEDYVAVRDIVARIADEAAR